MENCPIRILQCFCFYTAICVLHSPATAQSKIDSIKLDLITKVPEEIDGCSESLALDKASLKAGRYLVITNLQDLGFISIHGKLLKLKSKNGHVYEGKGYTVVIKTKTNRSDSEDFSEKGTVEIRHGQIKRKFNVVGEGGC